MPWHTNTEKKYKYKYKHITDKIKPVEERKKKKSLISTIPCMCKLMLNIIMYIS